MRSPVVGCDVKRGVVVVVMVVGCSLIDILMCPLAADQTQRD